MGILLEIYNMDNKMKKTVANLLKRFFGDKEAILLSTNPEKTKKDLLQGKNSAQKLRVMLGVKED
jgi:hypothetical protein